MRFPVLISLALAAAAACTPPAPPADGPQTPAGGSVAAAQAKWETRRPAAYAYDLTIACFCIHRGEYRVEVRNGEITSARDAATPVRAAYHPELGYPTEVEVGMLANDSGTLYTIQNLRAL